MSADAGPGEAEAAQTTKAAAAGAAPAVDSMAQAMPGTAPAVSPEIPGDIPPGFRRFRASTGFISVNGPLFFFHDGPLFKLGFRVEPRHCNPMGICHGGMLATFADMLMPIGALALVPELRQRFLPTVSLQLDFMAGAQLGDWVEGEMQVLRTTRTMVFMQGLVKSNGVMALRCSGVFKIGPLFDREAMRKA
jgi:uncharacterized protein (TIGR00369 family)